MKNLYPFYPSRLVISLIPPHTKIIIILIIYLYSYKPYLNYIHNYISILLFIHKISVIYQSLIKINLNHFSKHSILLPNHPNLIKNSNFLNHLYSK